MIAYFYKDSVVVRNLLLLSASVSVICYLLSVLGISFNWVYVILSLIFLSSLYIVFLYLQSRNTKLLLTLCFAIASVVFLFSVNYVFTDIMEPHQQTRIKVALGMEDDPRGAGYNVNQSKIAIGSGGLWGKGFLNGTQTKLKYVPEQDTDFIFCTIGEEEGFWGASLVVILFFALIIRIIQIAERQRSVFGRVYGYCVASILFFHLAINVGMDRVMSGDWYTFTLFQLWRIISLGIYYFAFHTASYRCRSVGKLLMIPVKIISRYGFIYRYGNSLF